MPREILFGENQVAASHTPHGIGVAAILPFAMSHNRSVATAEMADVAVALGADRAHSAEELSHMAVLEVSRLFAAIGIPASLKGLDMPEDRIAWTAEQAIGIARLIKNNPRPIDLDGMQRFLNAAMDGNIAAAARQKASQTFHGTPRSSSLMYIAASI